MIVNKEKFSGIFIASVGLYFLIYSLEYSIGSFSNMGPALFPLIMSCILLVLGSVIFLRGLIIKELVEIKFKTPLTLLCIVVMSGVIFKMFGAILASTFLILTSAMIHGKFRLVDTLKIILLSVAVLIVLKLFLVKLLPL